ncbi:transposable element Tcb1 transposase [Trichonephila clavipes]|uniref:Transposable element Tcb1 transposase n=1 Tax=Trichonephila clavipes TaxID=2585209 RepID=A0A8X6S3I0_TRICX|nr:transposable element Tcb1 transposase [Trichonephila clavipes]
MSSSIIPMKTRRAENGIARKSLSRLKRHLIVVVRKLGDGLSAQVSYISFIVAHKYQPQKQWEHVIRSEESSFTLFQTIACVVVLRSLEKAFHIDSLVRTGKHRRGSEVVGVQYLSICWSLLSSITIDHYQNILADHLDPLIQTLFPGEHPVFQDDNTPVSTSRWVKTGYMNMMMKLNI